MEKAAVNTFKLDVCKSAFYIDKQAELSAMVTDKFKFMGRGIIKCRIKQRCKTIPGSAIK